MKPMLLSLVVSLTIAVPVTPAVGQPRSTKHPGRTGKRASDAVHRPDEHQPGRGRHVRAAGEHAVIEVFKDADAWCGENREHATLLALGKTPGVDYFIHPVAELADGISPRADVVLLPSNGCGVESSRVAQNDPAAQANLGAFVSRGGVLILAMGDNDWGGGYRAPGAFGTPDLVFPNPPDDATLTARAIGSDGQLGTSDDHPIVWGPDRVAGTGDDLDNTVIDMCCYVAHGNLTDGIAVPPSAAVLLTATFDGLEKPILAEYCSGTGRVIVDTVTKEFGGHTPAGEGPSTFMSALFGYALDPSAHVECQISGLMDSVKSMLSGSPVMLGLQAKLRAAMRGIAGGRPLGACGSLQAFQNAVRAHRGKHIAPATADAWAATSGRLRRGLGCH
jgi:hypothetical protein